MAKAYPSHGLQTEFKRLGPNGMTAVAEWMEAEALRLRASAARLMALDAQEKSIDARLEYIHTQAPRAVRRFLKQGQGLGDALHSAASVTNLSYDTVAIHWKRFMRNKGKEAQDCRAQLIYEMAYNGISNLDIAARLGLHPVSISRILCKEKREHLLLPSEPVCPVRADIIKKHIKKRPTLGRASGKEKPNTSKPASGPQSV